MPTSSRGRRQTLGGVSNTSKRRDSVGGGGGNPGGSGIPSSAHKGGAATGTQRRTRKSRVSMIPRMGGQENNNVPPPSPKVMAPTAASRRRSVAGNRNPNRRQTMGTAGGSSSSHPLPPMAGASPARNALPPSSSSGAPLPPTAAANNNNTVVRTDPRPIHDKAFQQECIRKLMNFLLQNGYEYPVSQKSLSRPSGKDFANIVTFLLRQVDPMFQENFTTSGKDNSNPMKLEDEVAMNFKALGYPFTISKTALVAAGSPHTWPTLLAALTWLVELLQILQEDVPEEIIIQDAKPFASLEELEITTDKVFFAYLDKAYAAFLQGDEAMQEQLENALADRFEKDDGYIEQEIERITDLNGAMVEKMNDMKEESKDLSTLTKKREDYTTDLEQFRDLIRQMDDHIAALNKKVQERSEELGTTNQKLDKMNKHIDNLKQTLEKQAVSVGDMYKVQSELKGVDEAMERAFAVKEKLRKSKWENEETLANYFTDLEALVADFNTSISEVALLPCMDDRVASLKVALDKNQALQKDQSKLLGVDLAQEVGPALTQYKNMYVEKLGEAQHEYQQALDDLEASKVQLSQCIDNLKTLESQQARCEETFESESKTQEAKLALRLQEVESIETSVSSINDPVALEEQMAKYERQIAELEAMRLQQQEESLAMKRAVEEEIGAACQAVMEMQNFCQAKAAEVSQYWMMKRTMNSTTVTTTEKDAANVDEA